MKRTKKKGQSSIEFLILLGLMLILFNAFFITIINTVKTINLKNDYEAQKEVANHLYQEIITAYQVNDNYQRRFELPKRINEKKYSVTITNPDEITITTKNKEWLIFLPFNLTNQKNYELGRENKITKQNNEITITRIRAFE